MGNRNVEKQKFTSNGQGSDGVSPKSARDELAAKQRAERRKNRGAGNYIDWSSVEAARLLALVVSATRAGEIISFSLTRDGNALKVAIYDGDERHDEYCRPTEDVELFIAGLLSDYE